MSQWTRTVTNGQCRQLNVHAHRRVPPVSAIGTALHCVQVERAV